MWTANEDQWSALLEKHFTATIESKDEIPPLVHQIWLGPDMLAPELKKLCAQWDTPGWNYRMWQDADVEAWEWQFDNAKEAFYIAKNYGEKSDIFRLEILYRHGGLYVDVDFEKLANFDSVRQDASFFCGKSNVGKHIELNNGLIAASPQHELLTFLLERLGGSWADWGKEDVSQEEKVAAILKARNFGFAIPDGFGCCISTTGPGFFTRGIFRYFIEHNPTDVKIYPTSVFYSKPNAGPYDDFSPPDDALAVHHWARTWQK